MNHLNLATINKGLPNLDCLLIGELEEARAELKELARQIKQLASYAEAKHQACYHRAAGRIAMALKLEAYAQQTYNGLDEALKW